MRKIVFPGALLLACFACSMVGARSSSLYHPLGVEKGRTAFPLSVFISSADVCESICSCRSMPLRHEKEQHNSAKTVCRALPYSFEVQIFAPDYGSDRAALNSVQNSATIALDPVFEAMRGPLAVSGLTSLEIESFISSCMVETTSGLVPVLLSAIQSLQEEVGARILKSVQEVVSLRSTDPVSLLRLSNALSDTCIAHGPAHLLSNSVLPPHRALPHLHAGEGAPGGLAARAASDACSEALMVPRPSGFNSDSVGHREHPLRLRLALHSAAQASTRRSHSNSDSDLGLGPRMALRRGWALIGPASDRRDSDSVAGRASHDTARGEPQHATRGVVPQRESDTAAGSGAVPPSGPHTDPDPRPKHLHRRSLSDTTASSRRGAAYATRDPRHSQQLEAFKRAVLSRPNTRRLSQEEFDAVVSAPRGNLSSILQERTLADFGGSPELLSERTKGMNKTQRRLELEGYDPNVDGAAIIVNALGRDLNSAADGVPISAGTAFYPWPGSYWPTYLDCINFPWNGSPTAPQKYQMAFGSTVDVPSSVTRYCGVQSETYPGPCATGADCPLASASPSACSNGVCIPTWEGLCHAWAAAASVEPEPRHPVQYNGVVFDISDIKALLTLSYDYLQGPVISQAQAGGRCRVQDSGTDALGRQLDWACRDSNPATVFLVATNVIGQMGLPFVADRDTFLEVWNVPVFAYHITQYATVTYDSALFLVSDPYAPAFVPFSPAAASFRYVEMDLVFTGMSDPSVSVPLAGDPSYIYADHLRFVLELDPNGNVIGGEWVGESKRFHPDFVWAVTGKTASIAVDGIDWANVKLLLNQSLL